MEVRLFTIEDYDGVYMLWLETPGMGLNAIDDSREGIARYLNRNPTTSFVAAEDGEIIGAIMAGHDGRRGYIHHLVVAEQQQRRGIGQQLVDHAMAGLSAEGISKSALVVFADNNLGNGFWERIGFTTRPDLVYRNKAMVEMPRIPTRSRD